MYIHQYCDQGPKAKNIQFYSIYFYSLFLILFYFISIRSTSTKLEHNFYNRIRTEYFPIIYYSLRNEK